MAKKATNNSDRSDPKKNKSLAIRRILEETPNARASEIVKAVKSKYGHSINVGLVYMIKSKVGVKNVARTAKATGTKVSKAPSGTAAWIQSIRAARMLISSAGSVENGIEVLKAMSETE